MDKNTTDIACFVRQRLVDQALDRYRSAPCGASDGHARLDALIRRQEQVTPQDIAADRHRYWQFAQLMREEEAQ